MSRSNWWPGLQFAVLFLGSSQCLALSLLLSTEFDPWRDTNEAFLQNLLFLRPDLAHLLGGMEKLSVESTYPHWYVCFKGKEEETWTLLVPEESFK